MFVTHAQFRGGVAYSTLVAGNYRISYHDNTHLKEGAWTFLLDIDVRRPPASTAVEAESLIPEGEPFFTVRAAPELAALKGDQTAVVDALSLGLARTGLLTPSMSSLALKDIVALSQSDGMVLVPDSNALYNGTLHWLLRTLSPKKVMIFPIVVSLTQIQARDAMLKSFVFKRENRNLRPALRSRAFVNASLSLLERFSAQYQVIELDPSLLRYVRPAGKGSVDHDESDVLEDRLLVEGIHNIFRSMRTRTDQRVVTSDVLLARVLRTEGIPTLFLASPLIGAGTINCINYNPIARAFGGGTLSDLLWDLTHTFSVVRLTGERIDLQLDAYWDHKGASDWAEERLRLTHGNFGDAKQGLSAGVPVSVDAPLAGETRAPSSLEHRPSRDAGRVRHPVPQSSRTREPTSLSGAVLPQCSLLLTLRLGGALKAGRADLVTLLTRIPPVDRPLERTAKAGLEILRRVGALVVHGGGLAPTNVLSEIDSALEVGNLDKVSSIMEGFEAYRMTVQLLRTQSELHPQGVDRRLGAALGGPVAKEAAQRLLRFPIMVGQAWTDGDIVRDGSARPAVPDFLRGLHSSFKQTQIDGLARVSDLLPAVCKALRMSPWAVRMQINNLVASGQLRELSFQPAAGGKPVAPDHIIVGTLERPTLEPVPIDRLVIGRNPVFSVSGDLP